MIYRWIVLARIIMSWLPEVDYYNPMVRFVYKVTEPVLAPFRQLLPAIGGIDFSPIVVFLVLDFVRRFLVRLLISL
ncbi:MAG: YggT family protein [Firmicutes bacterium]|jgi:YggT family protein|nr:YggT family protein [Bacillota bacterium]